MPSEVPARPAYACHAPSGFAASALHYPHDPAATVPRLSSQTYSFSPSGIDQGILAQPRLRRSWQPILGMRGKRWLCADVPLRHLRRRALRSMHAECAHTSPAPPRCVGRAFHTLWAARTLVRGVPWALRATRACVCPVPTREQGALFAMCGLHAHLSTRPGFALYRRQALLSSLPRHVFESLSSGMQYVQPERCRRSDRVGWAWWRGTPNGVDYSSREKSLRFLISRILTFHELTALACVGSGEVCRKIIPSLLRLICVLFSVLPISIALFGFPFMILVNQPLHS